MIWVTFKVHNGSELFDGGRTIMINAEAISSVESARNGEAVIFMRNGDSHQCFDTYESVCYRLVEANKY